MCVLFFLCHVSVVNSADGTSPVNISQAKITPQILKAKIKEVDATADLDADTKATLTELYRKALSNLEAARSHMASEKAFMQARKEALDQAKTIRKKLEKAEKDEQEVDIDVNKNTPTTEIEQKLLSEKANFAAVDAKLADIEDKLSFEAERPNSARQRITNAKHRQDAIATELKLPVAQDQLPVLTEAKQWVLQSESVSLNAELKSLDKELLSQPMRVELLTA